MVHGGTSVAASAVAEESEGEEGMDAREREGARRECVALTGASGSGGKQEVGRRVASVQRARG